MHARRSEILFLTIRSEEKDKGASPHFSFDAQFLEEQIVDCFVEKGNGIIKMGESDADRNHYNGDHQQQGRRGRRPSKLNGHGFFVGTPLTSSPPLVLVQNLFDSGWSPG
jgi:hypothetical protein